MDELSLYGKRKRPGELFWTAVIYGAASLSVFLLLGIMAYVFSRGFRVLSLRFFFTATSALKGTVGIGGNLLNTFFLMGITLSAAVPLGVGCAVYLNEYAGRGRMVRLIELTTEILAGIPSVIFGLFGMVFFGRVLGLGYSLLSGSLTLAIMVLPLIVRSTQEALAAVPDAYREGALGLGAAKWYMIRTILLPCARTGILTGILLAVGRILGESAALLFTAGSARLLPKAGRGFWENVRGIGRKAAEPGGTLAVELYLQMQKGEYKTAFGIGCVLIMAAVLLNLLLRLAGRLKG